jgi:hypothetical protein
MLNRGAFHALPRGMTRLLHRERRTLVSKIHCRVESLNEKDVQASGTVWNDTTRVNDSLTVATNAQSPQLLKITATIAVDFDFDLDDGG